MGKQLKNEFLKILKCPTVIGCCFLLFLMIIYAYFGVGMHYHASFKSFSQAFAYTDAQTLDYIANLEQHKSLAAMVYILHPSLVIDYTLASVNSLGIFISCALGIIAFGNEYKYTTLKQIWSKGTAWFEFLCSKIGGILLFLVALILGSILLGYSMRFITVHLFAIPIDLVDGNPLHLAKIGLQLSGTMVSLLLWCAFGACIVVFTQNMVTSLVITFLYVQFESLFWSLRLARWFPLFGQKSMLPHLLKDADFGGVFSLALENGLALNESLWLSSLYTLLFLTLIGIGVKFQKVKLE